MHDQLHGIVFTAILCLSVWGIEAIKKDIVFVLDTSGSISNQGKLQAVNFIYNVTEWLTIGPDDILVSVVTFNTSPKEHFKLKQFNNKSELLPQIKQVAYGYTGGGTDTAEALMFVRQNSFLLQNGGRPNANTTVVLLTDGQSHDRSGTLHEADLLKSTMNTEIFVVGIGSAVSRSNDEIRGVSSDPDSYYIQQVDSFIYLCNLVPAMVPKLDPSSQAMAILNCPTPPSTTSQHHSSDASVVDSSTATPTTSHYIISGVTLASYDVTENDTNGNDPIPLIVGLVLGGLAALAIFVAVVSYRKRRFQMDVPWTKQYNEMPEGQFNVKFNPASLRCQQ